MSFNKTMISSILQIYFAHSTAFDFKKELYDILKKDNLYLEHNFILPHDENTNPMYSKDVIKESDLIFAEVSYPSTGLGIELGWAEHFGKEIFCFARADKKVSSSLSLISHFIKTYNGDELLLHIKSAISAFRGDKIS